MCTRKSRILPFTCSLSTTTTRAACNVFSEEVHQGKNKTLSSAATHRLPQTLYPGALHQATGFSSSRRYVLPEQSPGVGCKTCLGALRVGAAQTESSGTRQHTRLLQTRPHTKARRCRTKQMQHFRLPLPPDAAAAPACRRVYMSLSPQTMPGPVATGRSAAVVVVAPVRAVVPLPPMGAPASTAAAPWSLPEHHNPVLSYLLLSQGKASQY